MSAFLRKLLTGFLALCLLSFGGFPLQAQTVAAQQTKKFKVQHQSKVDKSVLHLKFVAGSGVQLQNGIFSAPDAAETAQLNTILENAQKISAERLHGPATENVVSRSLSGYYKIRFAQDIDIDSTIAELQKLSFVEEVYAQPKAAPLPGKPVSPSTPSYSSLQQYLKPAPTGVDSAYAAATPGGNGSNVKIVDIEYSWNTAHEDLTKARAAVVANGTPVDPFNDNNHGTAVLGEMLSDSNSYGVSGIVGSPTLELINAYNQERGWDPAGALSLAASRTEPGDIIIIEQQTWGPTADANNFVPVEWIPEVYDAIKALTDSGRIVLEPAGNGNQNLDDAVYYGYTFPANKPDSGAIIVGAGEACTASQYRTRLSFSTYGQRVNVQGPGNCVVTTGYGDLYSTRGVNAYYTQTFSGTSSATPVVAAAAASVSSVYQTNGTPLTAVQLRNLLVQTGTPQANLASGAIGPYPDLAKALPARDATVPTIPQNLTVRLVGGKPVLAWNASTDNAPGVISYRIYRGGVLYSTTTNLTYTDSSIRKGKTYQYQVQAVDAAGNASAFSTIVSITIL